MAMIDTYRNSAQRKRDEMVRLQQDKSKEATKIANSNKKISSAQQALSRTSSTGVAKSKISEIERETKNIANAEKKIADIEKKVANKQRDLNNELKKIAKEEEREYKKQVTERQKQMRSISQTLNYHSTQHNVTNTRLNAIENLPETITVLFLASSPLDQTQLRLDEEAREITEKIRAAKHRDSVKFVSCWATRPLDILQALNEHTPAIVHFSGHGSNTEDLVFQGDNGKTKLVSKEAIVQTIMASSDTIRLVFFNACYSHSQAEAVVQHVEAAIGMNTAIGDDAARVFSATFYSAVGFGLSVKKAFQQAKAALMLEGIREEDTPELFVNSSVDAENLYIVQPLSKDKGL